MCKMFTDKMKKYRHNEPIPIMTTEANLIEIRIKARIGVKDDIVDTVLTFMSKMARFMPPFRLIQVKRCEFKKNEFILIMDGLDYGDITRARLEKLDSLVKSYRDGYINDIVLKINHIETNM